MLRSFECPRNRRPHDELIHDHFLFRTHTTRPKQILIIQERSSPRIEQNRNDAMQAQKGVPDHVQPPRWKKQNRSAPAIDHCISRALSRGLRQDICEFVDGALLGLFA